MIDLHIHTNYSDGTDGVVELLRKAEQANLEIISITDHDRCNAYDELKGIDINKYYSGRIVNGVEIKCWYKTRNIEILGYGIDTNKIKNWLEEFYKDKTIGMLQTKYFDKLYDVCKSKDLIIENKENIIWEPKKDWASMTIYKEIKRHIENKEKLPEDLWEDQSLFPRKYIAAPESEFYLDKSEDYPSVQHVIEVIHKSNGLAFLAHAYSYKNNDIDSLLEDVRSYSIDGIESYYSTFTNEQIKYLINYCKENKLYMCGGSDYHGMNKPEIEIGIGKGNLNVPKELIKNWINKVIQM